MNLSEATSENHPMPPKPERMPMIDVVRIIAALMVLCFHYLFRGHASIEGYSPLAFPDIAPIAQYGYLGVPWFFMISGLVIAYSSANRTPSQFVIARISRLLPSAWAAIILLFLLFIFVPLPLFRANLYSLLANFTFLPQAFQQPLEIGSFWTIQIEVIFYIWVAVLIRFGVWHRSLYFVAVWLTICLLNNAFLHNQILHYLFITREGPFFCLGILLYRWRQKGMDWPTLLLMEIAFVLGAVNLMREGIKIGVVYHTNYNIWILVGALFVMTAILAAFLHLRLPERWQRFCYIMGGMTYPLYLIHEALGYRLFWLWQGSGLSASLQFILAASIAMAVAFVIWVGVEKPLLPRLRKGLLDSN